MGQGELVLDGWTDKPRYERASHHLLWGIAGHNAVSGNKSINMFTRILGRTASCRWT